jgi:hypothetical protein
MEAFQSSNMENMDWPGKWHHYGDNNRCTRGRRERGLGVLDESAEEVTLRNHRDDTT